MAGPINYGALLTQVDLSPLSRGLQLGEDRRDRVLARKLQGEQVQLATSQFTKAQLEDQSYQADIADLQANFSPEKLREVMWKHPSHLDALDKGFQTYTRGAQQAVIHDATSVLGALSSNNRSLAVKLLKERRQALANSAVNTDQTDDMLRLVQSDDPADLNRAYTALGVIMAGAVGVDHAAGMLENFGIGAKADAKKADSVRADRAQTETERHHRVIEGQGQARVGLSAAASARADRKAASGPAAKDGAAAPTSISTVGGKTYVKSNGKWYAQ